MIQIENEGNQTETTWDPQLPDAESTQPINNVFVCVWREVVAHVTSYESFTFIISAGQQIEVV